MNIADKFSVVAIPFRVLIDAVMLFIGVVTLPFIDIAVMPFTGVAALPFIHIAIVL